MEENKQETPDPVTVEELDEDQAAHELAEQDEQGVAARMTAALDPEEVGEAPEWAVVPTGLKLPEEGTVIAHVRIPAKWTRNPGKGDRTCILWPIGETEERLAYQRSRGDMQRSISELSKAAIRAVDGHKADWSGNMAKPGSIMSFWSEIGPKGRAMIRNWYLRTHSVTDEEALDFFSNHFAATTVRRG